MKTITQKFIKGLLVIVLFTGVSVALSTTGVQTVSEAHAGSGGSAGAGSGTGSSGQGGQVSSATVNQYLVARGYTVQSLSPICGSVNWRAYATSASGTQYMVTVYVQSSQIVASNDSAL